VLVAADGADAHAIAVRLRPDLVVSDLVMPYRDGFDIVRALREDLTLAHVPIVILSMKDREEDIVRASRWGRTTTW